MLMAVIVAGAVIARVPMLLIVGMVVVTFLPVPVGLAAVLAVAIGGGVLRARTTRDAGIEEGGLLRELAGRVAAGASIRSSIADPSVVATPDRARRLAGLGLPMADVGREIAKVLPNSGAAFRAICSFSEHTGAAISTALSVLAERVDEASELARQRRVALAQVKFSAVVVGVVPIAVSMGLLVLRGIPEPGGAAVVAPMLVGLALQICGTAVVFKVASQAR